MNEQQKDIEEFINVIKEELMDTYNISDDEATACISQMKMVLTLFW
ncbi:hypothetical protein [Planococcus antarcticus]|nr:hypothetical protein [Planococcus antarcticus]